MSIIGLENDNYCVHTPIPVQVTGDWTDTNTMKLEIYASGGDDNLIKSPILYASPVDNSFYIDISPWVRLCMAKLNDVNTYTGTLQTISDPYDRDLQIRFDNNDTPYQQVLKTFVHCALSEGYRNSSTPFDNIRVWKCYPFSWVSGGDRNIIVPGTDSAPSVPGTLVEYDTTCCGGTYLKWLNEYGFYNYWLFPANSRDMERESDEIFRMPRNIFDPNKNSNVDTAGFIPAEIMTVRDIVPKRFWPLIKSLTASPEVYMLKNSWTIGSNVSPNDWVQIIQSDASFERSDFVRSAAEVEMEFEIPKIYTQTRL